jgi:hypothetical protein
MTNQEIERILKETYESFPVKGWHSISFDEYYSYAEIKHSKGITITIKTLK